MNIDCSCQFIVDMDEMVLKKLFGTCDTNPFDTMVQF